MFLEIESISICILLISDMSKNLRENTEVFFQTTVREGFSLRS